MNEFEAFKKKIEDVDFRVTAIEELIRKKRSEKVETIPKNYVYLSEFSSKYMFISSSGMSDLIKQYPKNFEGHFCKFSNKLYIDPMRVIQLIEDGVIKNNRIVKQYKNWKPFNKNIQNICIKLQQEQAKNLQ